MRSEIDQELMREAMEMSRALTRSAAVEAALRLLVKTLGQGRIRDLRGKVLWEGDLESHG